MIARTIFGVLVLAITAACGGGAPEPGTQARSDGAAARVDAPHAAARASTTASTPSIVASPSSGAGVAAVPKTTPALTEADTTVPWAPRATPEEAGLDRVALERLVESAEAHDTHALLVIAKGRTVVERRFGRPTGPIDLMSVTKGIVGLTIGKLVDEGKILSLDAPLSTWFPEWKLGAKAKVTLRHVLSHTSGLDHKPMAGELTRQKDRLAYVRALPIVTSPGDVFSYNNEATQLLAGVVQKASGKPLDVYAAEQILEPLGITDHPWVHDEAGTPPAFWGLSLDAADLAKVGAMILARGRWNDRQILSEKWIDQMQTPGAENVSWHGLLTWLSYDGPYRVQTPESRKPFADLGFDAIVKLAPLDGRRFTSQGGYWLEAGALLAPGERETLASMIRDDRLPYTSPAPTLVGFNFNGWLGQYVVWLPKSGVVAVRLRRERPGNNDEGDNAKNGMSDFPRLVSAAVPKAS